MNNTIIKPSHDTINHPYHYNTNLPHITIINSNNVTQRVEIECIDVIRNMPTWKCNAIKYLWRAGLKIDSSLSPIDKEIEDLQKAIFYIEDRIKQLQHGR